MTTHSIVEIYRRQDDDWGWRLIGANGEKMAQGEGYTTKEDAKRGWLATESASREAEIRDA